MSDRRSGPAHRAVAQDASELVRVRKVWPPDGVHPLLGLVRVGGEYECAASLAVALVESGEFERADEPRRER